MKRYVKKSICSIMLFFMCNVLVTYASIDLATFNNRIANFRTEKYDHGSTYQNNPSLTGGETCFGFANEVALYIWGSYPTNSMSAASVNSGWTVTYGGSAVDNLCVGDIVRYHYHSIFITGIDGDTIYYCQANTPSGTNKVTFNNTVSRSSLKSKVSDQLTSPGTTKTGWVAHYTDGITSTPTDTEAPTISGLKATNVSGDSFTIECTLNDNVGVTRVWFVLYAPGGEYQFGESASNGKFSYKINTSKYGGAGTYSLHLTAYDAANNASKYARTGEICTVPPTNCSLISNKTIIATGETVTFTINAYNATEYSFGIGDGTNVLVETGMINDNSYYYTFNKPGTYYVWGYASNSVGSVGISGTSYTVYDVIGSATITSSKATKAGDTITFTINANNATEYAFGIGDGTNILVETGFYANNTYSYTFTTAGTYYIWGYARNPIDYKEIGGIEFKVYNPVENVLLHSSAQKAIIGDTITFTINANNATEYAFGIGDGTNVLVETGFSADNTYSYTFTTAGTYYIWGYVRNPVGYSSVNETLSCVVIDTKTTNIDIIVKNISNTYAIDINLYNITNNSTVIVAGYKNNSFITLKSIPYSEEITTTLTGDIDEIRVMVWDNMTNQRPLCATEVIPSSEFIIE